ncbi:MAG: ferredoxin [Kiritimatiellae bacterium]|nr:ferredoxin [Kiritimatiellia bacterium]
MKAIVNEAECVGCGLCVDACPEVFEMNEENIAEVIADPVPPEAEESCREAAENCPTGAISLED